MDYIKDGTDDRIYAIAELIWHGADLGLIWNATKIDMFFLEKIKNIIVVEHDIEQKPFDVKTLKLCEENGSIR